MSDFLDFLKHFSNTQYADSKEPTYYKGLRNPDNSNTVSHVSEMIEGLLEIV